MEQVQINCIFAEEMDEIEIKTENVEDEESSENEESAKTNETSLPSTVILNSDNQISSDEMDGLTYESFEKFQIRQARKIELQKSESMLEEIKEKFKIHKKVEVKFQNFEIPKLIKLEQTSTSEDENEYQMINSNKIPFVTELSPINTDEQTIYDYSNQMDLRSSDTDPEIIVPKDKLNLMVTDLPKTLSDEGWRGVEDQNEPENKINQLEDLPETQSDEDWRGVEIFEIPETEENTVNRGEWRGALSLTKNLKVLSSDTSHEMERSVVNNDERLLRRQTNPNESPKPYNKIIINKQKPPKRGKTNIDRISKNKIEKSFKLLTGKPSQNSTQTDQRSIRNNIRAFRETIRRINPGNMDQRSDEDLEREEERLRERVFQRMLYRQQRSDRDERMQSMRRYLEGEENQDDIPEIHRRERNEIFMRNVDPEMRMEGYQNPRHDVINSTETQIIRDPEGEPMAEITTIVSVRNLRPDQPSQQMRYNLELSIENGMINRKTSCSEMKQTQQQQQVKNYIRGPYNKNNKNKNQVNKNVTYNKESLAERVKQRSRKNPWETKSMTNKQRRRIVDSDEEEYKIPDKRQQPWRKIIDDEDETESNNLYRQRIPITHSEKQALLRGPLPLIRLERRMQPTVFQLPSVSTPVTRTSDDIDKQSVTDHSTIDISNLHVEPTPEVSWYEDVSTAAVNPAAGDNAETAAVNPAAGVEGKTAAVNPAAGDETSTAANNPVAGVVIQKAADNPAAGRATPELEPGEAKVPLEEDARQYYLYLARKNANRKLKSDKHLQNKE